MPGGPRSWLKKGFHRRKDVKDQAGSQDQGQDQGRDDRDKRDLAVVVTPCSSSDDKGSAEAAAGGLDSRLPSVPATDFAGAATSTDADGATCLPVQLWDRAYDELKREEPGMVDKYEKILSRQLQEGPNSTVPESQPNTIAQANPDVRRRQMIQLIHAGLDKTAREATVKEYLGVAAEVVLSTRDIISSAIQAVPQAALAWAGICLALEVCFRVVIGDGGRCSAC